MKRGGTRRERWPKGVEELARERGGRRYRATIRKSKNAWIHLGLYETPWLAGLAYSIAAKAIDRESPPLNPPPGQEPTPDQIRAIDRRVRARLDPETRPSREVESPPTVEALTTFLELTVLEFWRREASEDHGGKPGEGLEVAAKRVVEAARLLFWSSALGHPDPFEVLRGLLARRLNRAFGVSSLTREILDDDGDDPWRVARWLVYPEARPGERVRGFREEIKILYAELFDPAIVVEEPGLPGWAEILGVEPPYTAGRIKAAYRARCLTVHPDGGGTDAAFVELRAAFQEAMARWGGEEP